MNIGCQTLQRVPKFDQIKANFQHKPTQVGFMHSQPSSEAIDTERIIKIQQEMSRGHQNEK